MGMSLSGERPIVTGRVPSGTSFNTAPSNFRSNLDISVYSPPAAAGPTLPGIPLPNFQTIEHPFRVGKESQDDHTDVVDASVFIGQIDEPVRCILRRGARQDRARDFRVGYHARQSVRAQQ